MEMKMKYLKTILILQVAVLGLKDEKYGEEACAVIRRDDSKLNNEEELRSWCRKKISRWKNLVVPG